MRERGFTVDNPTEDVTSSSTTGDYLENEWTGYSGLTIDVSGVVDKRIGEESGIEDFIITDFNRLLELSTSGNRCGYFKLLSVDPTWEFYAEGFMNVSSVNVAGSTGGLLNSTATLSNKSSMDVVVGTPPVVP